MTRRRAKIQATDRADRADAPDPAVEPDPALAAGGEGEDIDGPDPDEPIEEVDPAVPAIEPEVLPARLPDSQGVVLYDPLRRYLSELSHFKPLTAEEEKALAIAAQEKGDVEAAYKLVTSHLRLVVRIAFDFKRSWLNLLDLIQEGNVGLLLAVRKFDPYRGIRLSTYAAWWIRAYIIKFLLDNWRLVKVGTTNARRRLLFNLRKEKEALEAQGIAPVPKLLAQRLDVSEEDVIEVDRSLGVPDLSLESPLGPDSDQTVSDTLAAGGALADEQVIDAERHELLSRKLAAFAATLGERERAILSERLLSDEPATLQELGERFGLTREGLRQVEKRVLGRLKEFLAADPAIRSLVKIPGNRDPEPDEPPARPTAKRPAAAPARPDGPPRARRPKTPRS